MVVEGGGSSSSNADLYFQAELQDNVSPTADQIEQRLKKLGATKSEIKMFMTAYDQATPKIKAVQDQMNRLPKDHLINVRTNAEQAHRQLDKLKAVAAAPITLTVKVKDDIDEYIKNVKTKFARLEFEMKNQLKTMPITGGLISAGSSAVNLMSGPFQSVTGLPMPAVGAGAAGGVAALGAFMTKSFQQNSQMEQNMAQLTQIMRTQSAAQSEYKNVVNFATKTPFNMPDVMAADIRLRQTGVNPNHPTLGLRGAGSLAAGGQVPLPQATGAIQNASLGYFQELNTITGRNIRQSDFTYGGRYSGQTYQDAIQQVLRQYTGALQAQTQTFKGLLTNIQDVFTQRFVRPVGAPLFNQARGLEQNVANKLGSNTFQLGLSREVDKIQDGLIKMMDHVKQAKDWFKTSLEQPLKSITQDVLKLGQAFGKTFGATVLTGVQYLSEALVTITKPLADIAGKAPILGQLAGFMKALHMFGISTSTGGKDFFGGLATFNPAKMLAGVREFTSLMAKVGLYLTAKNFLDMKNANDQLNHSFQNLGKGGEENLSKLKVHFDALIVRAHELGKSIPQLKAYGAGIGEAIGANKQLDPHGKRLAQSEYYGALNTARLSLDLGKGREVNQEYATWVRAMGGGHQIYQQGKSPEKVLDNIATQMHQASSRLARTLGISLPEATRESIQALQNFGVQLRQTGMVSPRGAAAAQAMYKELSRPSGMTAADYGKFGGPKEATQYMLQQAVAPGTDTLKAALNRYKGDPTRGLNEGWSFMSPHPNDPGQRYKTDQGTWRNRNQDINDVFSQYRNIGASSQQGNQQILSALGQGTMNQLGVQLPQFKSVLPSLGIKDISPGQLKKMTNTQDAQELVKIAGALDKVQEKIQETNAQITKYQNQLSELSIVGEQIGKAMAQLDLKFIDQQRAVTEAQMALQQFTLKSINPLQRALAALSQQMADYQQKQIVPVQRAQEDWNQVMLRTSNRLEDVSFAMGKAQFEMGKFHDGMLKGENALTAQIHSLDVYNTKLDMLKLQNMGLQADLTKTQFHNGFTSTVKPLMGFTLEREIQIGQQRKQMMQDQYDISYGAKHWQMDRAARPLFQRMEMPFGQRMRGILNARNIIDTGTLKTREIQNLQYQEQLKSRLLQEQMYKANVGMRGMQDKQYELNKQMFKLQQEASIRSDRIAQAQLDIQKAELPTQIAQQKAQDHLTIMQADINKKLLPLTERLGQYQDATAQLHTIQGAFAENLNRNIKKGPDSVLSHMENIAKFTGASADFLRSINAALGGKAPPGDHGYFGVGGEKGPKHGRGVIGTAKGIFDVLTSPFEWLTGGFDAAKQGTKAIGGGSTLGTIAGAGAVGLAGLTALNAAHIFGVRGTAAAGSLLAHHGQHLAGSDSAFARGRGAVYQRVGGWASDLRAGAPWRALLHPSHYLRTQLPESLGRAAVFGGLSAVGHPVMGAAAGWAAGESIGKATGAATFDENMRYRHFVITRGLGRFIRHPGATTARGFSSLYQGFREGHAAQAVSAVSDAGGPRAFLKTLHDTLSNLGSDEKPLRTVALDPEKVGVGAKGAPLASGSKIQKILGDAYRSAVSATEAGVHSIRTSTTGGGFFRDENTFVKGLKESGRQFYDSTKQAVQAAREGAKNANVQKKAADAQAKAATKDAQAATKQASSATKQANAVNKETHAVQQQGRAANTAQRAAHTSEKAASQEGKNVSNFRKHMNDFGHRVTDFGHKVNRDFHARINDFHNRVHDFRNRVSDFGHKINRDFAGRIKNLGSHVSHFGQRVSAFGKNVFTHGFWTKIFGENVNFFNGITKSWNDVTNFFSKAVTRFGVFIEGMGKILSHLPHGSGILGTLGNIGKWVGGKVGDAASWVGPKLATAGKVVAKVSGAAQVVQAGVDAVHGNWGAVARDVYGALPVTRAAALMMILRKHFSGFFGQFGHGGVGTANFNPERGMGYASGGLVAGHGDHDSVQALLTPGEYVLRKNAVKRLGIHHLDAINKYAAGGLVGGNSMPGHMTDVEEKLKGTAVKPVVVALERGDRAGLGSLAADIGVKTTDEMGLARAIAGEQKREGPDNRALIKALNEATHGFKHASTQHADSVSTASSRIAAPRIPTGQLAVGSHIQQVGPVDIQPKEMKSLENSHKRVQEIWDTHHTRLKKATDIFNVEHLVKNQKHYKDIQDTLNIHEQKTTKITVDGFNLKGQITDFQLKQDGQRIGGHLTASQNVHTTYWNNLNKLTADGYKQIAGISKGWLDGLTKQIESWAKSQNVPLTQDKKHPFQGDVHGPSGGTVAGGGPLTISRAHGGLVEADNHKVGLDRGRMVRMVEEGHPEVVIPLAPHRRDRAKSLVKQTLGTLGLTPLSRAAGGYVFPVPGATWGRVDQGVDFTMPEGAPIGPMGDSTIKGVIPNWYTNQPFLYWQLDKGPRAGQYAYVAEHITSLAPTGSKVKANQSVARFGGPGQTSIEYGWATASGSTLAMAKGDVNPSSHYSSEGQDMYNFLKGLAGGKIVGGPLGGGGGVSAVQPINLHDVPKKLKDHAIAGRMVYNALKKAKKKWEDKLNQSAQGTGTSGGHSGSFPALPGGWFRVGATIDPTAGQAAYSDHGGFSFAELLEAGVNAGMRPDATQLLGLPRGGYGMAMGSAIQVRMPGAANAFKIWKNDVGSGQPGNPHFLIDLHQGIANAMGWSPNGDIEIKKAAGGIPRVARDNTLAMLHAGESVVSAGDTNKYSGKTQQQHKQSSAEARKRREAAKKRHEEAQKHRKESLHWLHKIERALTHQGRHEQRKEHHRHHDHGRDQVLKELLGDLKFHIIQHLKTMIEHGASHKKLLAYWGKVHGDYLHELRDNSRTMLMESIAERIKASGPRLHRLDHLVGRAIAGSGHGFGPAGTQAANLVDDLISQLHNLPGIKHHFVRVANKGMKKALKHDMHRLHHDEHHLHKLQNELHHTHKAGVKKHLKHQIHQVKHAMKHLHKKIAHESHRVDHPTRYYHSLADEVTHDEQELAAINADKATIRKLKHHRHLSQKQRQQLNAVIKDEHKHQRVHRQLHKSITHEEKQWEKTQLRAGISKRMIEYALRHFRDKDRHKYVSDAQLAAIPQIGRFKPHGGAHAHHHATKHAQHAAKHTQKAAKHAANIEKHTRNTATYAKHGAADGKNIAKHLVHNHQNAQIIRSKHMELLQKHSAKHDQHHKDAQKTRGSHLQTTQKHTAKQDQNHKESHKFFEKMIRHLEKISHEVEKMEPHAQHNITVSVDGHTKASRIEHKRKPRNHRNR